MSRGIVVYGGSFNPFGNHHLDVLRHLAEVGEFDHIVIAPSAAHPLKSGILPWEHRYNMAVLGAESRFYAKPSFPKEVTFTVTTAEVEMLRTQPKPIFTYNLLKWLRKSHGNDATIKFCIGPDILDEIDRWEFVDEIHNEFGFYECPNMGIHSQEIRKMLDQGVGTWANHVPSPVAQYIKRHLLYNVHRTTCKHEFQPVPDFSALWTCKKCTKCDLERCQRLDTP